MEILGLSSSQSQSGSFALVLGESSGNRRLPIIIGMFEAQAIAIEIEKIVPNRPMTHDLFRAFADNFEYVVEEIQITNLKEGVFYAKIVCSNGHKSVEIDARPSDAIAIGLRFGTPIYTYEPIMSEAGIVLTDEESDNLSPLESVSSEPTPAKKSPDALEDLPIDALNKKLKDALENEEYELAAKIRDLLNKKN